MDRKIKYKIFKYFCFEKSRFQDFLKGQALNIIKEINYDNTDIKP